MKNLKTFRVLAMTNQIQEQEYCCICLEAANNKESLQLLDCGCVCSWFHSSCEIEWVGSLKEYPYKCPICRRPTPLVTNYSFSFYSGREQRYLWYSGILLILEFTVCTPYSIVWILPWESLCMALIPFAFPSEKSMQVYFYNILAHNVVDLIFAYVAFYEVESRKEIFEFCAQFGLFHIGILLFFSHLTNDTRIDSFAAYAISREIKHRKQVVYRDSSVTQTPTNALKWNKLC